MPKTEDYKNVLTDEQVKYFAAKNFDEIFKSVREKLYCKLG